MVAYYKYYLEIRNRILLLLFAWMSLLLVCYYFKEALLFGFVKSNAYNNELNNLPYFIFTDVSEVFYVYLRITIFIANQIVIIMTSYHILMFIIFGLYRSEYLKLQSIFKIVIIAWICSIILLKEFIIPCSWTFFLSFQKTNEAIQPIVFFFEAKIVEYLNYFISLYYVCLINCQALAVLILFLNNISEKNNTVQVFRKLFYFIFIIFSTITTPPDVVSQIIMSFTLVVMYEFLVFFKYLKFN